MQIKSSTNFLYFSLKSLPFSKLTYLILSIGAVFCLYACAPQVPSVSEAPEVSAAKVWSLFQSSKNSRPLREGFSLKASIHLISKKQNNRFSAAMWGNYQLPIRMDLQTGFGSTFAYYREDAKQWIAYHPKQEKAFIHADSSQGFKSLGVETPFDLQELAWLLGSHWQQLLPSKYEDHEFMPQKGWLFTFAKQNKIHKILLGEKGQVLALFGQRPTSWQVLLNNWQESDGQSLPTKFKLKVAEKTGLRIFLKSFKGQNKTWPKSALKLSLPEDTKVIHLQRPTLFPGV